MDLVRLLLFLHIAGMFFAIAISIGSGIVLQLAYRTRQVAPIRGVLDAEMLLGPSIPIAFLVAGILGLLTAINFGYDLLSPWLVIAYVGFAAEVVLGTRESLPWQMKLRQLVTTTPDGPLTPEIVGHFTASRTIVFSIVEYAIILVLIFDMVVKPFSA